MPQPQRNRLVRLSGLEEMHGRSMPNDVRRDSGLGQRRIRLPSVAQNDSELPRNTRTGQRTTEPIREQRCVVRQSVSRDPLPQRSTSFRPKRDRAFFAGEQHLAAIARADISNSHTDKFRDARAGVVQKEKQQVIPPSCLGSVHRP